MGKPRLRLVSGLTVLACGAVARRGMLDRSGDDSPGDGSRAPTSRPDLKPALAGLVVTEPRALSTVPYAEFGTITTTWSEVEPGQGSFDFSTIDEVLSEDPDIRFRLRIRTGRDAPYWLKQATGGCITVHPSTENGATGCTAKFWNAVVPGALLRPDGRRWRAATRRTGRSSTSPTARARRRTPSRSSSASTTGPWPLLEQAGLTTTKHRDCIIGSTATMMSSFTRTRVSLAGHSAWEFTDGRSWEAERDLLNQLRGEYPYRLVLEDHGLGPDDEVCPVPGEPRETASTWHCYLAGLPPTETLRTAGSSRSTTAR